MTNYAAWDSFDVDHALDEVDQLQAIEEFAAKSDDILRRREKESLESIISATRKAADSLRSKVLNLANMWISMKNYKSSRPVESLIK